MRGRDRDDRSNRTPQKDPSAGVLLVGGSGGGIAWQDYWGDVLARHGFAALALGYFGMEGLPKELDEIPLDYFLGALEYMQRNAAIDRTRIGVVGIWRGGELALLQNARSGRLSERINASKPFANQVPTGES